MFTATPERLPVAFDDAETRTDEATLRKWGAGTNDGAILEVFRKRTLTDEELSRLTSLIQQLGSDQFDVRETASAELAAAGRRALALIRRALKDPDLEVATRAKRCLQQIERRNDQPMILAALRLVASRRPAGAVETLLNFLPFADDEVVEEEVLTVLGQIASSGSRTEPVLVAAVHSGVSLQRAAAGRLLGRSALSELREAARMLFTDPDAKVRLWTAQGFLAAKDRDALPILIELLVDAPQDIAWQAEDLLCRIAEETAPDASLATGTHLERRRCREAWMEWWRTTGAKLDSQRLDLEHRSSGRTLIVSYTGYRNNRGRVWERNKNGSVLWEITDVNGPIDVQPLPGGRILIAEYNGNRVTERDQKGRILWEYKWRERQPLGCQRLPNGNTVIACINEIREVAPDGKHVASFTQRASSILSFQKLRNGNLVVVTYDGVLKEMDELGNEVRTLSFERPNEGLVTVEALPGGHFLLPLTSSGRVAELDDSGREIRSWPITKPTAATRLPNGNLLACSNKDQRVVEMTRAGKVVWEEHAEGRVFRVRRR